MTSLSAWRCRQKKKKKKKKKNWFWLRTMKVFLDWTFVEVAVALKEAVEVVKVLAVENIFVVCFCVGVICALREWGKKFWKKKKKKISALVAKKDEILATSDLSRKRKKSATAKRFYSTLVWLKMFNYLCITKLNPPLLLRLTSSRSFASTPINNEF